MLPKNVSSNQNSNDDALRAELSEAAKLAHKLSDNLDAAADMGAGHINVVAGARGTRDLEPDVYMDAHDRFMVAIASGIDRYRAKLLVEEKASWTKIQGRHSGHKVYVSKQKGVVHVECTLPPDAISGAAAIERDNGRIQSLLPDDPGVVMEAIALIAEMDEVIAPPRRGAQAPSPQPGKKY